MATTSSAEETVCNTVDSLVRRSKSRKEVAGPKTESALFSVPLRSREDELKRMHGKNFKKLGCREAALTLKSLGVTLSSECEGSEASSSATKDLLQRVNGLMSEMGNIRCTLEALNAVDQDGTYEGKNCRSLAIQQSTMPAMTPDRSATGGNRSGNQTRGDSEAILTRKLLERLVMIGQISCEATVTHSGVLERLLSNVADMKSTLQAHEEGAAVLLSELQRTNKLLAFAVMNTKLMHQSLHSGAQNPEDLAEVMKGHAEMRDTILRNI